MCRVLRVHVSGFYAWLKQPESKRSAEDKRLLALIQEAWLASGCVYGSPRIHEDLRELGEQCGEKRVARIMRINKLRAIRGYKRRYSKAGKPSVVAPNHLQQQFAAAAPDAVWVSDITYIRTYEGWLYLAIVLDVFSRKVIGWSMQKRIHKDIVMKALLMAIWNRQPEGEVIVHSDQGSQYGSHEYQKFMKDHNLVPSMSRRGNCYDNAVAESFFHLLKTERIRQKVYPTRDDARADVFDYIEVFYNRQRRHTTLGKISPVQFEQRYFEKLESV